MNGRNDASKAADGVPVPGSGCRPTTLFILGEAPGKDEVPARKPFVGEAGERLWRLVRDELGLERDEAYVTNAVKLRPVDAKGDRRPTMAEIDSWRPDLMDELDVARPHVILALGVTALKALGLPSRLAHARLGVLSWPGIPVVATFHPGYLLRRPKTIEPMFRQDLKAVAERVPGFFPGRPF
jgi:uracil-DNA glycosylase family 4